MTVLPAVTLSQLLADLGVGVAIFVLAVVVTAVVLRLLQAVLPDSDSGAEAVWRAQRREGPDGSEPGDEPDRTTAADDGVDRSAAGVQPPAEG